MNSRWSDADAQGKNDLDLLVYASRLIGAETTLVVWGGGNTSVKRDERDHRNRPTRVLRVKGSGSDLKSIQPKDFPGVRMDISPTRSRSPRVRARPSRPCSTASSPRRQ